MMIKTKCDTRGRVYLRETLRSTYGENFVVIEAEAGILLLPVPDDPVKDLARLGRPLHGVSVEQIKARIAKRAAKEAMG